MMVNISIIEVSVNVAPVSLDLLFFFLDG